MIYSMPREKLGKIIIDLTLPFFSTTPSWKDHDLSLCVSSVLVFYLQISPFRRSSSDIKKQIGFALNMFTILSAKMSIDVILEMKNAA